MRSLSRRRPPGLALLLVGMLLTPACFLLNRSTSPTIEIVSPKSGETIATPTFEVQVKVTGVDLRKADDTHDPKTGHLHLYIDREPPATDEAIPAGDPKIIHSAQSPIKVSGLAPGPHTLYVVLGYGDHRPFRPAVQSFVTINQAGAPNRLQIVTPENGATVFGPNVSFRLSLEGAGIEVRKADGSHEQTSGHYHLFVDRDPTPANEPIPAGQPDIIHSVSPEIEVQGLKAGAHTVHAVFAYGDHVPFSPPLTSTVTFNVSDRPPPQVKFVSPRDGEAGLPGDVQVKLEVSGIAIKAADGNRDPNFGHFHLVVDREVPPVGEPIATGVSGLIHSASPEITVPALAPGRHTLTAVLGYGDHSRIPGTETPTITIIVGEPPPPQVTVEPQVVAPGQPFTVKGSGFAPEESVSLVIYDEDRTPVRVNGRANAKGDAFFTDQVPAGTPPGTYFVVIQGSSFARGATAVRVVLGSATAAITWAPVAAFSGTGNQDTAPFDITDETWRLLWAHRPKATPAYLWVEARKAGSTGIFDPIISSWRPERGEKLLSGVGRYFLRIVTDGSEWQVEVQQRAK